MTPTYPETEKIKVVDNLHGTEIIDNYRWLEEDNDKTVAWIEKQEEFTNKLLTKCPQQKWLAEHLEYLMKYDDITPEKQVLKGERRSFWKKNKDDEHWILFTKETKNAPEVELINPNLWDKTDQLAETAFSADGKYLAFGKAKGGDENPVISIMEVATKEILADTMHGCYQGGVSWLPDNSGFYFCAKPYAGEVPEGEEHYWASSYFHTLGTTKKDDIKVFGHDTVKEYWHYADVSEDGELVILIRGTFDTAELFFQIIGSTEAPTPLATGFDAYYSAIKVEDKFLITSNKNAPQSKVFITEINKPEQNNWQEFIPETKDNLEYIAAIAGKIYAAYLHNAYSLIKVYDLEGNYLQDIKFPGIGTASVSGYWSKPDVLVNYNSFVFPSTSYLYDADKNNLKVYHKSPVDVDTKGLKAEQVWYTSKDGTKVSMFLIANENVKLDGNNPVLLYAYGGFNISLGPVFSNAYYLWVKAGGIVAIPNLRGGGEYGKDWHEAGMREKKQNVFDDYIYAAKWLIKEKYTSPERLAIKGGSNGGLLMGAAVTQAPELFKVVSCGVPLLDMVRFHKFGYANIWSEEYGNADTEEQFKYIHAYSPYHNVKENTGYPSTLIVASANDARTAPLHGRKMAAILQEKSIGEEPILYLERKDSGHGGGTTISTLIEQISSEWAYLMDKVGIVK